MKKIFVTELNLVDNVENLDILKREYSVVVATHKKHEDIISKLGIKAPEYEVTECGLNVYHNGVKWENWEGYKSILRSQSSTACSSLYFDVLDEFESEAEKIELLDGLAVVVHHKDRIEHFEERLLGILNEWGTFTTVDVDGVLYIMPNAISKGIAVRLIYRVLGAEKLVVFGDNESDLSMMSIANKAYVHKNSKLLGRHIESATVKNSLSDIVKETVR